MRHRHNVSVRGMALSGEDHRLSPIADTKRGASKAAMLQNTDCVPLTLRARGRSSPTQACALAGREPASRLQCWQERKSSSPSNLTCATRFGTATSAYISVAAHCAYCEGNDASDSTPLTSPLLTRYCTLHPARKISEIIGLHMVK